MTIPWSVTPIKKSHRISGPKRMTSRGHRYVSPKPTPSAARSKPGPRTCNEAGGSGNSLIGIGSSLPACHTLSSCTCSVVSPGAPPLDVSTKTSFRPRPISARGAGDPPEPPGYPGRGSAGGGKTSRGFTRHRTASPHTPSNASHKSPRTERRRGMSLRR